MPNTANPLLDKNELPPFSKIKAEHVVPAIETLLAENRQQIENLLAGKDISWNSLIKPIEEMDDRLSQAFSPVSHMNAVVNSPELREAYNAVLPMLSEYHTEMGQNKALFEAYTQISKTERDDLSVAEKKALDNALRDFKLSGIGLPEAEQKRFAEISKKLSELSSKFNDNELDATMAWSKHITEVAELDGLPESTLALVKQQAEQKEKEGYLLNLDYPCYVPVMTYCSNRALREEMYEAFSTRASEKGPNAGEFDNTDIIQEILSLRMEAAKILGFGNYAERSLATKMAQTPDQVLEFLRDLASKAKPAAEKEFAEICEFALKEYGAEEVAAWDVAFYAEKLKNKKFSISAEDLRPYFPAPRVIDGLFEVVRRLYDLEINAVDTMETWHPDVTTYEIHKGGQLVARFYLDLYAREKKQGGAWMDECRTRRVTQDGQLQLPVAYLTCNFSPPVGGKPSLLTHDEVVTLFHEFGHGLHQMMTQVSCASVSGINGVAWDAVELPSQFMENWCWQPEALAFLSGHFETGEPLPQELLDKMLAAKNYNSAMATVRQLEFALFDFRMHMEFDGATPGQIQSIMDEVRAEVAVIAPPEYNRFQNAFGHVFGGGYAAGYYSYKWAEVLSADAFARFLEDGIFNRQTGEKFLATVLEVGGSVDAMDMFVAFRGREPDVDALLKQDGII